MKNAARMRCMQAFFAPRAVAAAAAASSLFCPFRAVAERKKCPSPSDPDSHPPQSINLFARRPQPAANPGSTSTAQHRTRRPNTPSKNRCSIWASRSSSSSRSRREVRGDLTRVPFVLKGSRVGAFDQPIHDVRQIIQAPQNHTQHTTGVFDCNRRRGRPKRHTQATPTASSGSRRPYLLRIHRSIDPTPNNNK